MPPIHWLFVGDGDEKPVLWRDCRRRCVRMSTFCHRKRGTKLPDVLAAGDVGLVAVKAAMQGLLAPSKLYGCWQRGVIAYIGPQEGRIPLLLRECEIGLSVRNGQGQNFCRRFGRWLRIRCAGSGWQKLARQLAETRFLTNHRDGTARAASFDVVGSR